MAFRSVAFRARIVLACATASDTAVARRLAGLHDEPRAGAPRTITDEAVEAILVKTLGSTRSMAKAGGSSHTMVGRIWRTFRLQPHRTASFKLSPDPPLIDKIRDVVGLYLTPPANAVVFAVDEKSQIQALQRAQPILPMDLGQPERRTHNYVRHGTLDVHVVLDNLSAHKAPPVQRWLVRHPRVQFHCTPTYASWLNLVERFFGLLTVKALKRGSHTSLPQLRAAILAYVDAHNNRGLPFKWVKTADQILDKMRRFGLRVQQVHGQ
jgi:transposase